MEPKLGGQALASAPPATPKATIQLAARRAARLPRPLPPAGEREIFSGQPAQGRVLNPTASQRARARPIEGRPPPGLP